MAAAAGRAPVLAWSIAGAGLVVSLGSLIIDQLTGGEVVIRDGVLAVAMLVVGARIASHAPANRYGWLLLLVGVLAAVSVGMSLATSGVALVIASWASFPSYALLALSGCFFPDGRPPSPRWRPAIAVVAVALGCGLVGLAALMARTGGPPMAERGAPGWDQVLAGVGLVAVLAAAMLALAAIVVRIKRAPATDRGPLIWAAASTALLILGMVLETVNVPYTAIMIALVFPAAGVVAIARYGLYDIDTVVHRSLLYGTLTLVVAGVYAGVAALVVAMRWAVVPEAFAAAAAVVAVLPLRIWLQRLIDRWLYGASGRPVELLVSLARGVGTALTPDDMLTVVVDGVAEGLRAPYVAVLLEPESRPARACGTQRPWPLTTRELRYRGSRIGELAVQQRAPDEPWTRRERRLLDTLALQVAAPAATVALIRDLQQARERLVTAREEERRRLRKDLHDGVGPALSGARMQLRAALAGLGGAPDDSAVHAIEDDLGLASAELRRAIEGLRPPALDRGLAAALSGVVDRHAQTGLRISLAMEDRLDGVPAAVEVALYRVLDEALTNCVRHAGATIVTVRIERAADHLVLTVTDDGRGYAGPRDGGVGTESMRQRCEELGGSLLIESADPHGTLLRATFGSGSEPAG